jgi:hypothetical protein
MKVERNKVMKQIKERKAVKNEDKKEIIPRLTSTNFYIKELQWDDNDHICICPKTLDVHP